MSYQEEDFAKNETQLEHVESTGKPIEGHAQPHVSATLAAMPMAPSPALLAKAVDVAEEDKVMPPKSAFRMEYWGLIFCLAYLFPAMGQGFDNGAANIAVNMPAVRWTVMLSIEVETDRIVLDQVWRFQPNDKIALCLFPLAGSVERFDLAGKCYRIRNDRCSD